MPAFPSFFSRKGKKGKKVEEEEPKYEAVPPPPEPRDPPAGAPPAAPATAAPEPEPSPAAASQGAPSDDLTEPMMAVQGPTLLETEKDPELGTEKIDRSPKRPEDTARTFTDERGKERGKLILLVPVLVLLVIVLLLLVLLFLGAMPAVLQTQFDSFMGRNNACQAGEKGKCVSAAPIMHYYMYRVQNDEDYSPENQNMANIPGALWYLHNEIVWHPWLRAGTYAATPKTRIERFLVFSRASQELYNKGMNFGVVNTYDLGKCSGPYKCENLEEYGPVVGCESWNPKAENNFPHGQWTGTNVYPEAVWYSLPGKCSSKKFWKQSGDCEDLEPSGACPLGVVPTGEWTCTYTYQKVGELRISDIEGIDSLENLVEGGGREYSREKDAGTKLHFWDNIHDPVACQKRVDKVKKMFEEKYPDQPVLEDPSCDFNVGKFYPYFPAGTFDGPEHAANATNATNATKNNNANISNATRLLVTWGHPASMNAAPKSGNASNASTSV